MPKDKASDGSDNLKRMKQLKYFLIAGFAVIAFCSIIIVSLLAIHRTDTVLKNKVADLTSSLNVQMKLNLESFMSRMETIGNLAFAAEESYTYDATDPSNDEYDALVTEKAISDKLYSLCIMENFVDYGIVYRNNHFIGKISNGTISLFGDRMYEDLHSMINRQRTNDGWAAGYGQNFKRIYYVKEIHENAVLIISFYASELEKVFDNPENLADMVIRLTDKDYGLIYSSDKMEVPGEKLPEEIKERVEGKKAVTILDNEYLVTVSTGEDNWYIICSIPTRIILKEKNVMRTHIMLTAIIASALAIILGMVLSIKLTDVITNMVHNLDTKANTDQLTGLLNKKTFEDNAEKILSDSDEKDNHSIILLDVDNFKGVNDTLGHAYGDQVLARIGRTLTEVFSNKDLIGRIGGDEFCVMMNIDQRPYEEYKALIEEKCTILQDEFHRYYTGENMDYKISCSIGIAMFPLDGRNFSELYSAADEALYLSKHRGKDIFTFFSDKEEADTE